MNIPVLAFCPIRRIFLAHLLLQIPHGLPGAKGARSPRKDRNGADDNDSGAPTEAQFDATNYAVGERVLAT
jgi:hypothetical protein